MILMQAAKQVLQVALDNLKYCPMADTIFIAAGEYTAPVNTTFNVGRLHAVLLGGYPHGGGSRNPASNP
jgi:hypothetical protein